MTKKKDNLNGSAELLARALQGVITEAVREGNEVLMDEMIAMEDRLNQKTDDTNRRIDATSKALDNTNRNMQSQFARQEKIIAEINRKME